jgi:hypothetical protein
MDHFIVFAPTYTHIYDIDQNTMTLKGSYAWIPNMLMIKVYKYTIFSAWMHMVNTLINIIYISVLNGFYNPIK